MFRVNPRTWPRVAVTVRTPLLLAGVLVISGLMVLRSWAGPVPALIVLVMIIGALVGWRLRWSASFTLIVGNRARSLVLDVSTALATGHDHRNLAQHRDGEEFLPQLLSVTLRRSAMDRFQSAAYELVVEGESYRQPTSAIIEATVDHRDPTRSRTHGNRWFPSSWQATPCDLLGQVA